MPVEKGREGGREGRKEDREGVYDGEVQKCMMGKCQSLFVPDSVLYPLVAGKSPCHGSGAQSLLLELGSSLAHLLCLLFCLYVLKLSKV